MDRSDDDQLIRDFLAFARRDGWELMKGIDQELPCCWEIGTVYHELAKGETARMIRDFLARQTKAA